MTAAGHDRLRPGLNHLAFHAGSRADVDALAREAPANGWTPLFADRHPYAGGPGPLRRPTSPVPTPSRVELVAGEA